MARQECKTRKGASVNLDACCVSGAANWCATSVMNGHTRSVNGGGLVRRYEGTCISSESSLQFSLL